MEILVTVSSGCSNNLLTAVKCKYICRFILCPKSVILFFLVRYYE